MSTPRNLIAILVLLFSSAHLFSVTAGPFQVVNVLDGEQVTLNDGGVPMRVRLLYVDSPEIKPDEKGQRMKEASSARLALSGELTAGRDVMLWAPGDEFFKDARGATHAVIVYGERNKETSAQNYMIRNGWSCYYKKDGLVPPNITWIKAVRTGMPSFDYQLQIDEDYARTTRAGIWQSNYRWMRSRSAEYPIGYNINSVYESDKASKCLDVWMATFKERLSPEVADDTVKNIKRGFAFWDAFEIAFAGIHIPTDSAPRAAEQPTKKVFSLAETLDQKISINLEGHHILDVADFLSQITGHDVLVPAGIEREITLSIKDGLPYRVILDKISAQTGLPWKQVGESIVFMKSP